MREILFRGKRVGNGEWAYGFFVHVPNGRFGKVSDMIQPVGKDGRLATLRDIDPETVGQYTGLTDVNGEKIFEGDIVQCWDEYNNSEFWAVVVFGNPNCTYSWGWSLKLVRGDEPNLDILCWVGMEDTGAYCEVISNIHDNPELLTEATL